MYLKNLELSGFKSFAKKSNLDFTSPISAIVGPNGSGKSNIAEAFRFVLGEQSLKSMRGKRGEDLIFNGSKNIGRSNRASVKVSFDNSKRFLNVDFDEVSIERAVHRDSVNQYFINGSQVRLRDVIELLASANIGSSGHHIISQGEADRILNANMRERREMIEDALGLKIYQFKLKESERKLEKTKENITHVQALRKEISPHLRFLAKQVEKIEKSRAMRDDLLEFSKEYFKRESEYLRQQKIIIEEKQRGPKAELMKLEEKLMEAKRVFETSNKNDKESEEIFQLDKKLADLRGEKDTVTRELGRIEGQIAYEEKRIEKERSRNKNSEQKKVSLIDVKSIAEKIHSFIKEAENKEAIDEIKKILIKIGNSINEFISEKSRENSEISSTDEKGLKTLNDKKESLDSKLTEVLKNERELRERYIRLQKDIEKGKENSREAERAVFTIMSRQNELRSELSTLLNIEEKALRGSEDFERDLQEAAVLAGRSVLDYEKYTVADKHGNAYSLNDIVSENRNEQEERRRKIEKIKIRLEESGSGAGEETIKEHREVKERDEFLEREIEDLEKSAQSLKELINELVEKLNTQFVNGIEKINKEFQNFFELMFGGGDASLSVIKEKKRKRSMADIEVLEEGGEEEESEIEEGIEINVSLPHKRVKGLVMLSGGERALTSIALLFAMSQVNPPPFLVLDETDAALDEANSRRYGDMIKNLSKYSQLILITHNRETMSRAGVLYGVTMGFEGISKLLSVKFEEAVAVAK